MSPGYALSRRGFPRGGFQTGCTRYGVQRGVESDLDLAHLYRDSSLLLAHLIEEGVCQEEAQEAVEVWESVRAGTGQAMRTLIARGSHQVVSSQCVRTPPSADTVGQLASAAGSCTNSQLSSRVREFATPVGDSVRTVWRHGRTGSHRERRLRAAALSAVLREPSTRTRSQIYEAYVSLGVDGPRWLAVSAETQPLHKAVFLRSLASCSEPRLRSLLSSLDRWRKWATAQKKEGGEVNPICPNPLLPASFLMEVSRGGPTA